MAYHRKESPTQNTQIAALQEKSQEVWGKEPRGSSTLTVQAYKRRLPTKERGIQFDTHVVPNPDGHPHIAHWSGQRPGVLTRTDAAGDYVAIAVFNFENRQPPKNGGYE